MKMKMAQFAVLAALLGAMFSSSPVLAADADIDGEFIIGPNYTNAPELTNREGVPRGNLHVFMMNSEDSKIYPGIAKNHPGIVP